MVADGLAGRRFEIEGVSNLTREDGSVNFFFKGDINAMLQLIGQKEIRDVTIEEPTLEEIFMHYYE